MNSIEKIFCEHVVSMFYDKNNNVCCLLVRIYHIYCVINNSRQTIQDHVDDEDKISVKEYFKLEYRKNTPLQNLDEQTILINDSGFYSLVIRSRKEIAKNFKKWVTSEVLPSIRKTGQYNIEQSQKAIKLEHMKVQLELTNAKTSKIREENKKKELDIKENEQKIEMKKLTLIDNSEFTNDSH